MTIFKTLDISVQAYIDPLAFCWHHLSLHISFAISGYMIPFNNINSIYLLFFNSWHVLSEYGYVSVIYFSTLFFFFAGDEDVLYKHGEKSAEILRSSGFRNLTFKAYNGCVTNLVIDSFKFDEIKLFYSKNIWNHAGLATILSHKRWMMFASGSLPGWVFDWMPIIGESSFSFFLLFQ